MSEEIKENGTPNNAEGNDQPNDQDVSGDELTKAQELANNQKIRAEKAEKELKEIKSQLEAKKEKPSETPKNNDDSGEPDSNERLDRLALKSEGITNREDQDLVLKEAKRLQMSVEDVIQEDYIKSKLKNLATQREAESGMPSDDGKPTGGNKGTVEYWLDKKGKDGQYITPSDPELATKVINARMNKETKGRMFSDDLHS